jgi:hypothetical protein
VPLSKSLMSALSFSMSHIPPAFKIHLPSYRYVHLGCGKKDPRKVALFTCSPDSFPCRKILARSHMHFAIHEPFLLFFGFACATLSNRREQLTNHVISPKERVKEYRI